MPLLDAFTLSRVPSEPHLLALCTELPCKLQHENQHQSLHYFATFVSKA